MGGQGRCEQRSEVFVKIQKKKWGGGGQVGGGSRQYLIPEYHSFIVAKFQGPKF